MALRQLDQATGLVHQVSGPGEHPPLVYLPGVHGDWTPLAPARGLLNERFQLVEAAYPRVAHWSLADFSQALENLLDALKLDSVHLVGESFGSLVAWEFGLAHPQRVRSLVLVGGFSHPPSRTAGLAKHALSLVPTALFETGVDMYVAHKNRRGEHRHPPSEGVPAYAAVRTTRGRRATANRMRLIQRSDFRPHLPQVAFPVRYIGGEKDRLVPVHRELRTLQKHLPAICNFQGKVLTGAPHMIIVSHPEQTVEHLAEWVSQAERDRDRGSQQPDAERRILLE